MKLGIDVDGPVADWITAVCTEHHKWFASNIDPKSIRLWDDIFKATKMKPEALFEWCKESNLFSKCDLVPGALGGLYELAKKHEITFVTARPHWAAEATDDWIVGNIWRRDFDYTLEILQDKEQAGCDIYLDDSPEVIMKLAEAGQCVVRFLRPWNRGLDRGDILTVDSWAQFTRLINQLKEPTYCEAVGIDKDAR